MNTKPIKLQLQETADVTSGMQFYPILKNYFENKEAQHLSRQLLWQALQEYLTTEFPKSHRHSEFVYAIDTVDNQGERICFHQGIDTYLGYHASEINTGWLMEILHPDERRTVTKFSTRMYDFFKIFDTSRSPIHFSIIHQIKKADGNYIRILRKVYPLLINKAHHALIYCCLCTDVTHHISNDKITLDVFLMEPSAHGREGMLAFFADIIPEKPVEFTEREIEVIKVWSETDSARLAAERLGITVRTLETHLKHARKKLNVKRSLDLVVFAKDRNLI